MQRRDFLTVAGAVAVAHPMRNVECGMRNWTVGRRFRIPNSAFRIGLSQEPSLSPEVFARRLDRARGELKARGLDLLVATPSTNYEYLTGYNPGRSERLIALLLPVVGAPAIVCPSFEVERIKRHSIVTELHGWEEQEDPHALVRETVRRLRPGSGAGAGGGTIALESSTAYQTFLRLGRALPGWKFVDAGPVTDRLRVIKSPEEVALLRRAIAITLDAMAATFAQLAVGTTEVQVAQTLSREMEQRGAPGGGLVQFGPSSGLRTVLHAPPRPRARHGWPRARVPRRRQHDTPRARYGVHDRARDLSAREVRGADRRRLCHDGQRRGGAESAGGETVTGCEMREAGCVKGTNPSRISHPASRLVGQFFREPDDPIERLLDVVQGRRVRQPHVAIVSERGARHQRHAGGGREPGAELRPRDPSERVHPEEEVERAERLHELDPGELLSEARYHDVPSLAEFGHHPRHVPFHLVVAERYGGGELSGVIRPRGTGRLQRGHRLRHGAGREREADPPSCHRIGLAHSVDHDHALEQVVRQVEERGRRARAVVDAAVDLVGDDPHLAVARPVRDRLDFGLRIHRPRGIAR